ncbi:MAG TPA: hypothetical protein VGP08_22820 [Pyrinomonadaceae bacterium]|jgi:hypothetical protein|nr:hypothetical protein [Pyrinomonadaceae bacterium]
MTATKALLLFLAFLLPSAGAHAPARLDAHESRVEAPVCTLCPVITVQCPDVAGGPGAPLQFSVKISGAGDSPSMTLNWSVTAGIITSGQTAHVTTPDSVSEITVDTTGVPGNSTLVATVEVSGLDRSCSNKASCATAIPAPPTQEHYDEYGDISFEHEQALLDVYAVALMNDPTMKGYVVCYGGRKGRRGAATARCERAKSYLVNRRGFNPDRIIPLDGGFREDLTVVLWMMPPDMKPPLDPTVAPGEVQFTDAPKRRKARKAHTRRRIARVAEGVDERN